MNTVSKTPEAKRLAKIRELVHDASILDDAELGWSIAYEGRERVIVDGMGDVLFRATAIATDHEFELVAHAPGGFDFLLKLLDRCAGRVRELEAAFPSFRAQNPLPGEEKGASRNYAAEAAMKVGDLQFRQFLRWHPDARPVGGASADRDAEEIATDRLRAILAIASRKELNLDRQAAERWIALREEFDRFRAMPDAVRRAEYPGYGESMGGGV